jgi:hypothetical protein
MMTNLLCDLGAPTMKSIEISLQIAGQSDVVGVSVKLLFSLIALMGITFNHKGVDVLFHTILEKRTFDPFIGFCKP